MLQLLPASLYVAPQAALHVVEGPLKMLDRPYIFNTMILPSQAYISQHPRRCDG